MMKEDRNYLVRVREDGTTILINNKKTNMKHAREDYNRIQDPENIIPQDEPVFLLRGKDICAPTTIRFWAAKAKAAGAKENIIEAALDQADNMEKWQQEKEKQIPDMP